MPFPDLSSLALNLDNIEDFRANAFVDDGGTWRSFGSIENASLSWSPVTSNRNTAGTQKQMLADLELRFDMQQTSEAEIKGAASVCNPPAAGHIIRVTKTPTAVADVSTMTLPADGYEFKGCSPQSEGEIDMNGEQGSISIIIPGRISLSDLFDLGDAGTITFQAA